MCDLWMEPPILETIMPSFRERKDLSLEDLAGPVKMMAIPQQGPQKKKKKKKLNKSIQLRTKIIKTVYTSRL